METQDKKLSELIIYVGEILKTYKRARFDCIIRNEQENQYLLRLKNEQVKVLSALEYKTAIEHILSLLDEEERYIIDNVFITKNDNPLWYLEHLSRSTYYRYKRKALSNFLLYF